jgi:peptidoglycan/LPS O-acetylase OafA/YrhL
MGDEYKQLGKHIAAGAGFVSNIILWNESGYFDNLAETKPLLHLWSLGIEEQFYIIWPLLLWVAWKKRFNLPSIIISITILSFILNVHGVYSDPTATFYSPQTRLWELSTGSLLAWLKLYGQGFLDKYTHQPNVCLGRLIYVDVPQARAAFLRNIQATIGFSLLIVALGMAREDGFPGWWAVLPTFGTVLIISAGFGRQAWLNRVVLSSPALVWLGLISYPLYLWHWPLLVLSSRIVDDTSPHGLGVKTATIALSIVLAWLTYQLIERHFRFGAHKKTKTIVLIISMLVVGGTGYYCFKQDGFKRTGLGAGFPKIVLQLAEYQYDPNGAYRTDTCHLEEGAKFNTFDNCPDRWSPNKNNILLWGDSHAAHLYPGYQLKYGHSNQIIQRTAGLCPPILGVNFKQMAHCKEMNDAVFDEIKQHKPEKVVLAANWTKDKYNWQGIETTIRSLKAEGVSNIDLVGPVPHWDYPLAKLLRKYIMNHQPMDQVPDRLKYGLNPKALELDSSMKEFSDRMHIHYISVTGILCNSDGCITRTGMSIDSLTAWDNDHLTKTGSEFLVSHFPNY